MLCFDIETSPLPDEELRALYTEPTLEEFVASCPSNWKRETCEGKYPEAIAKGWQTFVEKAALSPLTGRVVAIGYWLLDGCGDGDEVTMIDCDQEEADGLAEWWREVMDAIENGTPLVGWNVAGFDLPFLFRRSWILGCELPMGMRRGRHFVDSVVIDLMERWEFGRGYQKLDAVAKAFGLAGKVTEGDDGEAVSGADFHRVWRENRPLAEKYLRQDVLLCARIAERMGV